MSSFGTSWGASWGEVWSGGDEDDTTTIITVAPGNTSVDMRGDRSMIEISSGRTFIEVE